LTNQSADNTTMTRQFSGQVIVSRDDNRNDECFNL